MKFVMLQTAQETRTNWEVFEAQCPACREWNVFNRATDLRCLSPISHMVVRCLHSSCNSEFAINGDNGDAPYRSVYFDAYDLKARKRYGLCVLLLVQSFEMFFAHCLGEELVWRPFLRNRDETEIDDVNAASAELYDAIRNMAAGALRNVFIRRVLASERIEDVTQGRDAIAGLSKLTKRLDEAAIRAATLDADVTQLLVDLNESFVFDLRNEVVHKNAHRPTLEECDRAFDEVARLLFSLAEKLKVEDQAVGTL